MRPTQSLLLLLVLLLCGVAAFFIFRGGEGGTRGIAGSVDIRELGSESAEGRGKGDPADLESPEGGDVAAGGAERSALTQPGSAPTSARSGLAAERLVTGRVVDSQGRPVVEAQVFVSASMGSTGFFPVDLSEPLEGESSWFKRKSTSTDADGRFQIESPTGASAQIAIRASGFAPLDDSRALSSMDSTDLGTIELEEGVILAGRVLDDLGQPVAGVRLRAQATDGASGLITVFSGESGRYLCDTDEGGNFRVDMLRTGPFLLRFVHDDYPTQSLEGTAPRPGLHRSDYLVDMGRSLSIEGRVVGMPEDLPEHMKVSASPVSNAEETEGASKATRRYGKIQPDGRFRVSGLVEDVEYKVSLREGRGAWQGERLSATVSARTGDMDVVLEWRVDAAVELRAVHAITGEPIEEFELEAGIDWREPLTGQGGRRLRKHPGGRARFAGLHPRPNADLLSVRIEATGFEAWERTGLKIAEGEQLDLGDVALSPVPLLVVRVLDSKTGKPIRRSNVTLSEVRPELANSTDSGDSVQVSVRSASLSPVGGEVETSFEDDVFFDKEERKLTDEDGIARFSARPGKSFRVTAKHSKYAVAQSEVIVFPAQGSTDTEWTARLQRGGDVLVRALDTQGKPLVGRSIEHEAPGAGESTAPALFSQHKTDEAGLVRYEHLVPGTHRFRVGGGETGGVLLLGGGGDTLVSFGGLADSEPVKEADRPWSTVEVFEAQESTVDVTGPMWIAATGRVTEEGSALVGATVRLHENKGDDEMSDPFFAMGTPSARTGSDGTWSIEGVEPGEYELRITHNTRHQPAVFDVTLIEGENDLGTLNLPVSILEGRVFHNGEPVVGAKVSASLGDNQKRSTVQMFTRISTGDDDISFGGSGDSGADTVRTDETGAYRLRGLEADRNLFVNVEAEGFRAKRSELVRLSPGELLTDYDLELLAGATIEIEVVSAAGTPVGSALVRATYTGQEEGVEAEHQIADSQGKAVFEGMAPGAWIFSARDLNLNGGPPLEAVERTIELQGTERIEERMTLGD